MKTKKLEVLTVKVKVMDKWLKTAERNKQLKLYLKLMNKKVKPSSAASGTNASLTRLI